jgi:drug/metabolite transporter (DMT)-like permease
VSRRLLSPTLVGGLSASASQIAVGTSVAATSTLKSYPVSTAQMLRYGIAAVILLAISRRLPRIRARDLPLVAALAATGLVGFNVCLLEAVRSGDAGSVGVVIGGLPVVLALTGPLLRRQPPHPAVVTAAILVSAGAAAVQWTGHGLSLRAWAFAAGALACEAAFSILALPLLGRLGPIGISTYASLGATAMLGAIVVITGGSALQSPTTNEALAILELAVFVTAAAFVLWYSSLERIGMESAGLFAGLVPVTALVSTAVVGQTSLDGLRLVGAAAVAVGVCGGVRAAARSQDPIDALPEPGSRARFVSRPPSDPAAGSPARGSYASRRSR